MDTCPFNVLSLCSGVGGLDLGLHLAVPTARTVCYVEREAYCCEVLAERMEEGGLAEAPVWSNLRTFDGKPWRGVVDCITAGYPCQGFSVAGKRKGEKDERYLWPDVARIVREIDPRWCFFENVGNHLRLGFEQVHDELSEMGYVVAAGLFTAEEVGDTQKRERLFIVADRVRPQWRPLTQAGVLFHDRQEEGRQQEERSPGGEGEDVGGSPCHGRGKGRAQHELRSRGDSVAGPGLPVFPPGPEDWDGWRSVLSAEPKVEPAVRGVADGMAPRVDRLRACGNGVVPLVAAYAWRTLTSALEGIK